MAVRLSRRQDRFSVILATEAWLEPAFFAPDIALALKRTRSDAVRACRLQRGILFEGASREEADALVGLLRSRDVAALAIPDAELPLLPRAISLLMAAVDATGFATPSLQSPGLPQLWDWNNLALVVAGITLDPAQQVAALTDKVDQGVMADSADRAAMALRALDKARTRVFPLGQELYRTEPQVGESLQAAMQHGKLPPTEALNGFGNVGTVIDLVFTRPFERLRLLTGGRLLGQERSAFPARNLVTTLRAIRDHADPAVLAEPARLLAEGADSGSYLFEDLPQFEDYCRWAYRQVLGR